MEQVTTNTTSFKIFMCHFLNKSSSIDIYMNTSTERCLLQFELLHCVIVLYALMLLVGKFCTFILQYSR